MSQAFISRMVMTNLLLFLLGVSVPATATVTKLSAEAKTYLLRENTFKVISKTKDIPASVLLKLAEVARDSNLKIANPGEKFQVTDVIEEEGLPWRRLIWGVAAKDYSVIHYEGGIAHAYLVILFKHSEEGVKYLWGASSMNKIKNMTELRQLLQTD